MRRGRAIVLAREESNGRSAQRCVFELRPKRPPPDLAEQPSPLEKRGTWRLAALDRMTIPAEMTLTRNDVLQNGDSSWKFGIFLGSEQGGADQRNAEKDHQQHRQHALHE